MRYVLLSLFLLLCITLSAAQAQEERAAPSSREQVMLSFAPVVKKVTPAVVNIYSQRKVQVQAGLSPLFADPFFNQFFGGQLGMGGLARERMESSLGSGVVIDSRGIVVTSHHIIEGSTDIVVVLEDKREFKARILVADPSSDLALLKMELKDASLFSRGEQLPALPLVDSDKVEVGDMVLAVGNPFGVGQTVTSGIVSALSRSAKGVSDYDFFIQTDAAINPGNSGGALVNMHGELIGINTAIYSKTGGSLGIGFAIPSNMVLALLRNTQADGTVVRPWLGASYQDITPEIAESLGLRTPSGVLVAKVLAGSPAEKAGLQPGDVITQMSGLVVRDAQELKFRTHTATLKEPVALKIIRKGRPVDKSVTLTLPPETPARDVRTLRGKHPLDGVKVANLSPRVAVELGLDMEASGVVVLSTEGGVSASLGLQKGDIFIRVNQVQVTSTQQLASVMQDRAYGWKIMFLRNGQEMGIVVQR